MLRVGLNGFGRIGRAFTRIAFQKKVPFTIEAVNTGSTPPEMLSYLLQYDSVYRTFDHEVSPEKGGLRVGDHSIAAYNMRDPKEIPWDTHDIDVVIDCTGVFKTHEALEAHFTRGSVKKVILSAPSKDDVTPHVVIGVNDDSFDFQNTRVISNCSCTTNCAAPMFKVLHDAFGIQSGFLTTSHAYTSTQQLLDSSAKDYTRARAAALSLIPTTTGAAKAVAKVMPELVDRLDGIAIRAPIPVGSLTDISAVVKKSTTVEEVNEAFKKSAHGTLSGVMDYATLPLVSSDYIGSPYSVTIDPHYTQVMGGTLVKVFGWYDNEWGYSSRLVDLVSILDKTLN